MENRLQLKTLKKQLNLPKNKKTYEGGTKANTHLFHPKHLRSDWFESSMDFCVSVTYRRYWNHCCCE